MSIQLTNEQKANHFETFEHIHKVQENLFLMQTELGRRALEHDKSKVYSVEESAIFAKYTPLLKTVVYGSNEYKSCLNEMQVAIDHHRKSNSHHPEYYKDGMTGMSLIDLIEMLCDWKAATLRTKDGDIYKSLEIQKERFKISDQLYQILLNTLPFLENN